MKLKSDLKRKLKRTSTNGYHLVTTTKPIHRKIKKKFNASLKVSNKNVKSLRLFSDKNETTSVKQNSGFKPIVITMDSKSSQRTPRCLQFKDINKSTQSLRIKNSIVKNFKISSSTNNNNHSKITIAQSIIPDSIEEKLETEELLQNELIESDNGDNCINNNSNNNTSHHNMTIKTCNSNSSDKNDKVPVSWPIFFYSFRNKVVCVMQSGCKFSFYGKLKIQILYGAVEIYGATLDHFNTTTPRELYSPRGTSFIEIRAIQSKTCASSHQSSIEKILKENHLNPNDVYKFCNSFDNIGKSWTAFILKNFNNNLISFLEEYFPHKLFPSLQDSSDYSWTDRRRAEFILQANIYMEDDKKTINVSNFANVAKKLLHKWEVNKNMRALIAGGKSVGKSTNMRYLVNKLLEKCERVIVLDLDPGQSEFTPSGCISVNIINSYLLGPNFSHLKKPYHQIYIGGVNVTSCLANYIRGVKMLVDCLNEYLNNYQQPLPVIVNTMGFCKNIGWNIMCYTIKCIKLTDVIQIKSKILKNNFERLLSADIVNNEPNIWSMSEVADSLIEYELHNIDSETETRSGTGEIWNIEPHQQREIAMLAYLSQIVRNNYKTWISERNTLLSINAIIPYEVSFDSIKISLEPPTTHSVLSVINGNIVALCGDNFCDTQEQESSELQFHYPKVLSRAPLTTCYGFGIIRGIDMEKKTIYVNTPLSISMLNHVNCLIGCIPIPVGLLNLKRLGIPYTRGECNLPTSQDPRRGYFRMRHKRNTTVLAAE